MKILELLRKLNFKSHNMTMEEVFELTQMRSLEDCKCYMRVMLNFYFEVIKSPESRTCSSALEDDRNIPLDNSLYVKN